MEKQKYQQYEGEKEELQGNKNGENNNQTKSIDYENY